jgi:glycosyltransferase involved in cell wall biosynthesis
MASALSRRYGRKLRSAIVANAAFVPSQTGAVPHDLGTLRIGLLSNLDNSKGLDVFLDIACQASASGLDVGAVLAGPALSVQAGEAIARAQAELGPRLDYRGPVHDAAKQQFFRDIDVFVFPTRYVNEAQPTVIFEAFSYGVPVLTVDRGCIRTQVGASGEVFAQDADFVARALESLKRDLADRGAFIRRRLDVQIGYVEQNRLARQAAVAVFKDPPAAHAGTP